MSGKTTAVLGVDLGTSATKVVAVDDDMQLIGESERSYPLRTENGDEAVQDPDQVADATFDAVAERVAACQREGIEVVGLSFSAALHTLLAVDEDLRPLTPALSWADTRAAGNAKRLRRAHGPSLARTTGTPIHPMSPLVKLTWFAEHEPDLHRTARHWCGLKDYVMSRLTDRLVTDLSCASATGLLELRKRDWYGDALRIAGIDASRLPRLVEPTGSFALTGDAASRIGLAAGIPVVAGAGDGPLANLAVGAIRKGTAALSVGTSGALRVARDEPTVDDHGAVFCYFLAEDLWVSGGAVSNGGMVGQWAARAFGCDVGPLIDEAAQASVDGLMALPYLVGERAPWWNPDPRAVIIGLRAEHGRAAIARALVEGVAQQLALVLDSLRRAGAHPNAVRATGGALRSTLWVDALAAALEMPLDIADDSAGSGYGAAVLGWRSLGALGSLHDVADHIRPHRTIHPDEGFARRLHDARPKVSRVYHAIAELGEV